MNLVLDYDWYRSYEVPDTRPCTRSIYSNSNKKPFGSKLVG